MAVGSGRGVSSSGGSGSLASAESVSEISLVSSAVSPALTSTVRVVSAQPEFDPRAFDLAPEIDPFPTGDWGNYVKAAARVVAREYGVAGGMDALIDSTVPVAAGLSSSA